MKLNLIAVAVALFAASADAACRDVSRREYCQEIIKRGYCKKTGAALNEAKKWCFKSCGFCAPVVTTTAPPTTPRKDCLDKFGHCSIFVKHGYCKSKVDLSKAFCSKTCGFCAPAPTKQPAICGMPAIKGQRVIAGTIATRGSWPWIAQLLITGAHFCGSTIVGPRHVITASHCVERFPHLPQMWSIRVGEHNRKADEGSEADYNVKKIIMHPDYGTPSDLNNDIAVIELQTPIKFNKYVQPLCLPDKDVPVGTQCYITGWGKIHPRGGMTRVLEQAKMPVVSNQVCHKKNFPNNNVPVTDAMICTGSGGTDRKSGCQGDSGGPLSCKINGRWELQGVVSHGSFECDSTLTYSVFARVAYLRKWIDSVINN